MATGKTRMANLYSEWQRRRAMAGACANALNTAGRMGLTGLDGLRQDWLDALYQDKIAFDSYLCEERYQNRLLHGGW